MIILVAVTVIFVNSYFLPKKRSPDSYNFNSPELSSDETQLTFNNISSDEENKQQHKSKEKNKRLSVPEFGCEIEYKCRNNEIPYKAISGDGMDKYPIICFDNKLLIHKSLKDSKIGRGVNLVAIDGKTFDIKITETFDTYLEETFFLRNLKLNLNDGDIVIMASFDEMTHGLKEASVSLLENYGSQAIKALKFRDSFVMMGQKGLAKGKAIEMHTLKGQHDFAPAAHISGCAKFPLGVLSPLLFQPTDVKREGAIAIGSTLTNCGLPEQCKDNEFSVHVYTGKDNNDEPKICIDGKYVMAKGINDAGRGLNIVIVSNGKEIIRTGHFDTWQDDSTNLEIFLENLEDNVILIVATFDEASQNNKTSINNTSATILLLLLPLPLLLLLLLLLLQLPLPLPLPILSVSK
ncbi:unnamed protein product [Didymodactylos carnosus]|uniref:ILEI/PANDER domain-containing protein n=1 Tax=Didymodactylos carnosus TaxID=1234261 RepID=A0A814RRV3_9BILA|nr:unnamed protein product [Didymodactylos carnosus]CAF3900761.1 unnamed protein product [Didymodactylos carnosus]